MKFASLFSLRTLCSIAGVFVVLGLSTSAEAQNATAAFDAYNSAFLVQLGGQTYYSQGIGSAEQEGEWQQALDIQAALDRYQYTRAAGDRALVIALLNSLTYFNSPGSVGGNWQTDGWDDNLGWMVSVYIRGYQLTGIAAYLTEAEAGWNNGYNQGWDTTVAGGGIWENTSYGSKCALSNDPFIWEGVQIYQATGTQSYLTRAEAIYAWVRTNLANTTNTASTVLGPPGQVNGCVSNTGVLQGQSDNVYDAGSFTEAAATLYRATGNVPYLDDAQLTINHIMSEGAVIPYHNSGESGHQWAYWFTRGLSDIATDANLWGTYQTYLQNNANAAWSGRDPTYGITWNDWSNPTQTSGSDPNEMSSAAAIWQHLPPYDAPTFSGNYELLNAASNLAVAVSGNSTSNSATIVQEPFDGGNEALWTLSPTGGGYYHLENVNSGQLLNVNAALTTAGALIVQSPSAGLVPGNDRWQPVQNGDGTYSFLNLNSWMALDNPDASTASGTQLDQAYASGSPAQNFYLIPAASATTSVPTAPTPPSGLTAAITASNGVSLSWAASATSGATYVVYRSTSDGFAPGAGNQIGVASASATTYTDTAAQPVTTYYYVVEAADAGGTSAGSNEAIAVTDAPSFTMALSASNLTFAAGATGTDTITLTPSYGFSTSSAIKFACIGLPTNASCSFSPTTASSGNIVSTLTVSATALAGAFPAIPGIMLPGAVLASAFGFFGWKRRRGLQLLMLLVSVMAASMAIGCGGSSSSSTGTTTTAAPQYAPITVTATYTSPSGGTMTQTAGIELEITQ
jgi:hypothetical protein